VKSPPSPSPKTLYATIQDMSTLKIISIIILALGLTNCNTPEDGSSHGLKNKTVTTFLQVDTLPKFKYMVETRNLAGKILERIRYSPNSGLIISIEKYYYDSLGRAVLSNMTRFPENKHANTDIYQNDYDSKGLISKSISTIMGLGTSTAYYEHFPNKKIKQRTAISTSAVLWDGTEKYIYNKNDSLVKIERWDLNRENLQNRDSIAYTDTSKTVFVLDFENEISSKVITITKNKKVIRQIEYLPQIMSKDKAFYVNSEISFTYTNNQLTKKVDKTMASYIGWCGLGSPEKIYTYTYFYE
jgi:hypothetical protein